MLRPVFVLFGISLGLSACGSGSMAQTSTSSMAEPAPLAETGSGVIVSRTAPIPAAKNKAERVVFLRGGSVWMMGSDGQDPEQLTVRSLESADQGPRMSPDGTMLVYASAKDGTLKLYMQSMEDMIPYPIEGANDSQPAWSPDGTQIAFMRGDARVKRDLYVVGVEEASVPKLVMEGDDDHPELGGSPMWSADGKSLIFGADRREHLGTSLWKVRVDGGTPERLTPVRNGEPWTRDRWASLSPDGKRIVFASNRHGSSSDSAADLDVYSVKADGSGLTRLTDDPGTIAHPVYSSDGSRLYFASTRLRKSGYEWEIFVMAAGGGEQRRLTREARPENSAPSIGLLPGE